MYNELTIENVQKMVFSKYGKSELKPKIYSPYREKIVVDMPRKKGQYHGSSYAIGENVCHDIEGDIVVPILIKDTVVDNIKKENCVITGIHKYAGGGKMPISKEDIETQAHIHFKCRGKNKEDTIKTLEYLSNLEVK